MNNTPAYLPPALADQLAMPRRAGAFRMTIDDPAAVRADDAMINALATARMTDDTEEVFRLLAGWQRDVRAEPTPQLVDTDTALAVIQAARRRQAAGEIVAGLAVLVLVVTFVISVALGGGR